jgi:hypothetical protein
VDKFCPPPLFQDKSSYNQRFSVAVTEIVVGTSSVTTSYRNMESSGKSYPLIFVNMVRVKLTRTTLA